MAKKSKSAEYQPANMVDFGTSFHTTSLAPVLYEARCWGANGLHDIVFISSYVHDATFRADEIRLRRGTFSLSLERARWELFKHLNELLATPSQLIITGVVSYSLELSNQILNPLDPSLPITGVRMIHHAFPGTYDVEVAIDFIFDSKLRLRVRSDFALTLRDMLPEKRKAVQRKQKAKVQSRK